MRIYKKQSVFDAALERIRFLFDEFPTVIASISGGKDSTVILELALRVAREKNRLPLYVQFIDQEAEWQMVIDYVRSVMTSKEITPLWYQMPIRIFNATSQREQWLKCWDPEKPGEWMREKEPFAITENHYGTDRFNALFPAIIDADFPGKACYLAGMRAEESPRRYCTLTTHLKYKHITYGNALNKKLGHYTFYPIYDWAVTDVWKSIHDNAWDYCKIYDFYYQYGIPMHKMRVSNLHHESSYHWLFILQEVEPETWDRLSTRLAGINTTGQLGKDKFLVKRKDLPFMFKNWVEYRDYLLENLIVEEKHKAIFRKQFAWWELHFSDYFDKDTIYIT